MMDLHCSLCACMCALTLDQVVDAALGVLRNLVLLEAHIPTLHPP